MDIDARSSPPVDKSLLSAAGVVHTSPDMTIPKNFPRNEGAALDLEWVEDVQANRSAIERRAATLGKRRSVKKQWQAAWLLKAITCIDLTTLAGDDTPSNVQRLCRKAMKPLRSDLLAALGAQDLRVTTGAVCVYHSLVDTAVET